MALFQLEDGRLVPAQFGHDVPDGALGIERAKQAEVADWGAKKLEKYVAKKQKLEAEKKNG